jgi:hypothetical protein
MPAILAATRLGTNAYKIVLTQAAPEWLSRVRLHCDKRKHGPITEAR